MWVWFAEILGRGVLAKEGWSNVPLPGLWVGTGGRAAAPEAKLLPSWTDRPIMADSRPVSKIHQMEEM